MICRDPVAEDTNFNHRYVSIQLSSKFLSRLLKCCKNERKCGLTIFPSIGLERLNEATQSMTLSDVGAMHGYNKQEVEVTN